jgi:hypothetical protein
MVDILPEDKATAEKLANFLNNRMAGYSFDFSKYKVLRLPVPEGQHLWKEDAAFCSLSAVLSQPYLEYEFQELPWSTGKSYYPRAQRIVCRGLIVDAQYLDNETWIKLPQEIGRRI